MKMGSPAWKTRYFLRRNPWIVLAPLLLAVILLLGSCAVDVTRTWMHAAYVLWLLVGLVLGAGAATWLHGLKGKPKKWSRGRRPTRRK